LKLIAQEVAKIHIAKVSIDTLVAARNFLVPSLSTSITNQNKCFGGRH